MAPCGLSSMGLDKSMNLNVGYVEMREVVECTTKEPV